MKELGWVEPAGDMKAGIWLSSAFNRNGAHLLRSNSELGGYYSNIIFQMSQRPALHYVRN